MAWDSDKEVNPGEPSGELTSDEWDTHVQDQKNHSTRHEQNGSDELDVSGLSGVLADPQDPNQEAVQDIVGTLISGGANITTTYDGNDVLTVDTSALNQEEVEDAVAALVTAGSGITVNYDDPNDNLSIAVNESELSFYDGTNLTANVNNESVNTDNVQVGGGSSVSAIWGDSGEAVTLDKTTYGPANSSTTDTSFGEIEATPQRAIADYSNIEKANIGQYQLKVGVYDFDCRSAEGELRWGGPGAGSLTDEIRTESLLNVNDSREFRRFETVQFSNLSYSPNDLGEWSPIPEFRSVDGNSISASGMAVCILQGVIE